MKYHYRKYDFADALGRMPIEKGDVLFLHSNIGFFGRPEGISGSPDLCSFLLDSLLERVGPNGTVVVPTFTYSFPRGEPFDINGPVKEMGTFSEWVRCHPDAKRSCDPSYSVAAIGTRAAELTENAPVNSFGENSFFHRFDLTDGMICNLNFDAGSTFLHFLERELNVSYRFDKTFEGHFIKSGNLVYGLNTIYVRYISDDLTKAAFEPFNRLAIERKLYLREAVGRGQIGCIRASHCKQLIRDALSQNHFFMTRAYEINQTPKLTPEATYKPLQ